MIFPCGDTDSPACCVLTGPEFRPSPLVPPANEDSAGLSSGLELIEPFLRIKWAWTPAYLATGMPTASGPITTSFILFLNRENKLLEKILRFFLALKFLPLINPSSSSVFVTRTLVAMSICTSYTLLFRVGRLVSSVLGTDYL